MLGGVLLYFNVYEFVFFDEYFNFNVYFDRCLIVVFRKVWVSFKIFIWCDVWYIIKFEWIYCFGRSVRIKWFFCRWYYEYGLVGSGEIKINYWNRIGYLMWYFWYIDIFYGWWNVLGLRLFIFCRISVE